MLAMPNSRALLCLVLLSISGSGHAAESARLPAPLAVRDHENGLRSAMLSRPLRGNTLVALQFEVGSFQDPDNIPGLAHLAEHVFLRQPVTSGEGQQSLRDFLKSRGGRVQANTSHTATRFFFELNTEAAVQLIPALGAILRRPQISSHVIASEIAAINDEFAFLKTRQSWLLRDALKATTAPEHPFRRFSAGNLQSFSPTPLVDLQRQIKAFFKAHYHPGNTTVMILSPETQRMQSLLETTLARLPAASSQQNSPESSIPALFRPQDMPQNLAIQVPVSRPHFNLLFPLNGVPLTEAERAIDYLTFWTDSDAAGSWRQRMLGTGLTDHVALSRGIAAGDAATLAINLLPSELGLKNPGLLVATVIHSLQALMAQAQDHPLLRYKIPQAGATLPTLIDNDQAAEWLHELTDAKHSDRRRNTAVQTPNGPVFSELFRQQISPGNLLFTRLSNTLDSDSRSPVFAVPYRLTREQIAIDGSGARLSGFTPPLKLSELDALPELAARAAPPALALKTPTLTTWYSASEHQSGQLLLRLSLDLPALSASARDRTLSSLLLRSLDGDQSGRRWYQHDHGLGLELRGDEAFLIQQLATLADQLQGALSDAEFTDLKQDLISEWRQPPRHHFAFEALVDELKLTLQPGRRNREHKIQLLEPLGIDALQNLQRDSLRATNATLFVYGASKQQAERLSASLALPYKLHELTAPTTARLTLPLSPGQTQTHSSTLSSQVNALLRYQQAPGSVSGNSAQDFAHLQLLLPMMKHQYFAQLREQRQLAYGVTVVPVTLNQQQGLAFIAQSARNNPERLHSATEEFLASFPQWLNTVPSSQLDALKASVLSELDTSSLMGEQLADHYWSQIASQRSGDWSEAVKNSISAISLDDMETYYQRMFGSENQRTLIFEGWPAPQQKHSDSKP